MARKLASIQKIKSVESIEGADFIELVHVLGWQCVAKKGEFKEGDNCIYFEIDSYLPIEPEFEFLRKNCYKNTPLMGEGFRLKTQTFKKKISQGLCLPVSILESKGYHVFIEGTDVTTILGVRKYEVPEMATTGGNTKGKLPAFIPHTDETRIQAEPELLKEFKGNEYYITTKIDGSSHSIGFDEEGFHVTGHNYEYKDDDSNSFYRFVKKAELPEKLENFVKDKDISSIVIQGEYAGPGIQKNKLKLNKPEWYVFNAEINGKRVDLTHLMNISKELDLVMVPIEETGSDLLAKYADIDALLIRAEGNYISGSPKEGIVIRPVIPIISEITNTYLSMKVINNKFLLKNKE